MQSSRKMFLSLLAAFGIMAGLSTSPVRAVEKEKPAKTEKIDINNATIRELEDTLDGVGAVTAKKIVDGRPYKTIDDLVKAGVPEKTAEKIAPHITFGKVSKTEVEREKAAKTEKIDINNATIKELEDTLDGVGAATAKKIVEGRPYKTIDDLVKAGVPEKTAEKIAPHITFGKVSKTEKKEDTKVAKGDKTDDKKEETEAKVPPKKGMVWVNTNSKVYHVEGDQWYGKTKKGEFMTEEDAIKSGAHKSKND